MSTHGTYVTDGDRPAVVFERRLAHPVEAVWKAVSDPAELAHWFPQRIAEPALVLGGTVTYRFEGEDEVAGVGKVVEHQAPHLLAFTWFDELLMFELEPLDAGAGTLLRFTQLVTVEPDAAARNAAGWHVCLDVLDRALAGEPAAGPDAAPTSEWRAHYDHYVAAGVPAGAPVPGGA